MSMFAAKTVRAWQQQARDALDALQAAGAAPDTPLLELDNYNHQQFCLLVEATYALGLLVDQEVLDRAEMRPVEEIL